MSGPELRLASEPLLGTMYGTELGVELGPKLVTVSGPELAVVSKVLSEESNE